MTGGRRDPQVGEAVELDCPWPKGACVHSPPLALAHDVAAKIEPTPSVENEGALRDSDLFICPECDETVTLKPGDMKVPCLKAGRNIHWTAIYSHTMRLLAQQAETAAQRAEDALAEIRATGGRS